MMERLKKIILTAVFGNILCVFSVFPSNKIDVYFAERYDMDAFLILDSEDSTFFFFETGSYGDFKECGIYKVKDDTLKIFPECAFAIGEKSSSYKRRDSLAAIYATISNHKVITKSIDSRIFLKKRKTISDISLAYYYPNDSNAFSGYEEVEMKKMRRRIQHKNLSKLAEVYVGDSSYLFLNHSDSTFAYHDSKGAFFEVGSFKSNTDTLALIPKCQATRNDESDYICHYHENDKIMDTAWVDAVANKTIVEKRICVRTEECIKEIETLGENETFKYEPMSRLKIRQSRKEKSILYSRKVLDKIY